MTSLTLVVVELVRVVPLKLMKQLDNVGVGVGPAEGVASAVEEEDEISPLLACRSVKRGG
jgi:hypothetical protein